MRTDIDHFINPQEGFEEKITEGQPNEALSVQTPSKHSPPASPDDFASLSIPSHSPGSPQDSFAESGPPTELYSPISPTLPMSPTSPGSPQTPKSRLSDSRPWQDIREDAKRRGSEGEMTLAGYVQEREVTINRAFSLAKLASPRGDVQVLPEAGGSKSVTSDYDFSVKASTALKASEKSSILKTHVPKIVETVVGTAKSQGYRLHETTLEKALTDTVNSGKMDAQVRELKKNDTRVRVGAEILNQLRTKATKNKPITADVIAGIVQSTVGKLSSSIAPEQEMRAEVREVASHYHALTFETRGEPGAKWDINAFTTGFVGKMAEIPFSLQQNISFKKQDDAIQNGFSHAMVRFNSEPKEWQSYQEQILASTPLSKRAEVEKEINFAQEKYNEYLSEIYPILVAKQNSASKGKKLLPEDMRRKVQATIDLAKKSGDYQNIEKFVRAFGDENPDIFNATRQDLYVKHLRAIPAITGDSLPAVLTRREALSTALMRAIEPYFTDGSAQHILFGEQGKGDISHLSQAAFYQSATENIGHMLSESHKLTPATERMAATAKYAGRVLDASDELQKRNAQDDSPKTEDAKVLRELLKPLIEAKKITGEFVGLNADQRAEKIRQAALNFVTAAMQHQGATGGELQALGGLSDSQLLEKFVSIMQQIHVSVNSRFRDNA